MAVLSSPSAFLKIVVQAVEAAQKQMIVDALGIELHNLLVLVDGQLQDVVGAGTAGHVAEGAEINAAEKLVGFQIFGIALDDVLRFFDRVGDTAGLDVKFSEAGGQKFRRRIGIDGEPIFLCSFGGQVAAAVGRDHLLIHVSQRVMVVGGCVVDFTRRRLGRLGVGQIGFRRGGWSGLAYSSGCGHRDHQISPKNMIHARPDCAGSAFPKPQLIWMQSRGGKGAFILT